MSTQYPKASVLVLDDTPDTYFDKLCARFPEVRIELCRHGDLATAHANRLQPQIILTAKSDAIPGAIKRKIIMRPGVEWVQICGSGFDHLNPISDFDAVVTNCAGVLSEFLGETMIAMMMTLSLGFPAYFRNQQARLWEAVPRRSIAGKTVLIVGLGHVGRDVARRCKQANMTVLGVRNNPVATECVDEVGSVGDLLALLPRADYVCLHTPLTAATHDLFSTAQFSAMKSGSYFLNAARGGIVDEEALAHTLISNHLAGAYSDVFALEPLPADSPLWSLENLIITPHISDSIDYWERRYVDFFADNLQRWLDGDPLENIVDPKKGY